MCSHLQSLAEDLQNQIGELQMILNYQHFVSLKNLLPIEKQKIANTVLEWRWDIGSTKLMKFLQKANILSMTDMILFAHKEDMEYAQLILTDLLETEYILLADLMKNYNCNDSISLLVCDILHEGFKRMCRDIVDNPMILKANYLCEVETYLLDEDVEQAYLTHLNLLLDESPQNSSLESITNQQIWNDEFNDKPNSFNSFLDSIVGQHAKKRQNTVDLLLKKCLAKKFRSWKFLLLLFRKAVRPIDSIEISIDDCNNLKTAVKKFLKDALHKCLEPEFGDQFYVMLLVARQITQSNEKLLGSYSTWYAIYSADIQTLWTRFKDNIGEMKYFFKIDEFRKIMELLTKLVEYESDENILNIEVNTYMPAPMHCNELVLNYKQLCRSRLLHLKDKTTTEPMETNENVDVIFVTDDSD